MNAMRKIKHFKLFYDKFKVPLSPFPFLCAEKLWENGRKRYLRFSMTVCGVCSC